MLCSVRHMRAETWAPFISCDTATLRHSEGEDEPLQSTCAQLTGQTVFPVAVETQTAILSVIDKAVDDVLSSSYVDAVSQDKGSGTANVSFVLQVTDKGANETAVSA